MPVYEPEDFDKMSNPEEMAKAKKEALAKRARLETKAQQEVEFLESQFNGSDSSVVIEGIKVICTGCNSSDSISNRETFEFQHQDCLDMQLMDGPDE